MHTQVQLGKVESALKDHFEISGTVVNDHNEPIEGAQVLIYADARVLSLQSTLSNGTFQFGGILPKGTHVTIHVSGNKLDPRIFQISTKEYTSLGNMILEETNPWPRR